MWFVTSQRVFILSNCVLLAGTLGQLFFWCGETFVLVVFCIWINDSGSGILLCCGVFMEYICRRVVGKVGCLMIGQIIVAVVGSVGINVGCRTSGMVDLK